MPLTTTTLVLSPVLVIFGVVVSLSNAGFADPYWLDLSSKSTVGVLFLAPGFAALCAWDAARWRSLAQTSVRSWVELLAWQLLYVVVATAVTFAVTLAILYAQVPPAVGAPRFDVLALGTGVTAAYAAVGFAFGRFMPRLVAASAAFGVVWLWVAYTPAVQPFWMRNVTGNLGTSCCAVDTELAPMALTAPAVLALGLLVGVCVILTWSHWRVAQVGSALVVVAALALSGSLVSSVGADPVQRRSGAQECLGAADTRFCGWPEHAAALSEAAPVLVKTVLRLREAGLDVPESLHEDQKANGWSFSLAADSPDIWGSVLATSKIDDLPPACTDDNGGLWPAGEDYPLVGAWLAAVGGVPEREAAQTWGASPRELKRLLGTSAASQLAWFDETDAAMRTCEPVS
ncbi:MAG: hypothetical protein H0X12_04345 [Nocardioides sp.]|nr:hypothetical protein [Nocardioides sp.]